MSRRVALDLSLAVRITPEVGMAGLSSMLLPFVTRGSYLRFVLALGEAALELALLGTRKSILSFVPELGSYSFKTLIGL